MKKILVLVVVAMIFLRVAPCLAKDLGVITFHPKIISFLPDTDEDTYGDGELILGEITTLRKKEIF